jgi:hypothetical protein
MYLISIRIAISKVIIDWATREPEVANSINKQTEDAIAILSGVPQKDFQASLILGVLY